MLIVSVRLLPGGDVFREREIARMALGNVSHLAEVSDYWGCAREGANPLTKAPAWESIIKLRKQPRRRSVWALVCKAAAQAVLKEQRGDILPWS